MMLPLPLKPPRYSMGDSLQVLEIEAKHRSGRDGPRGDAAEFTLDEWLSIV